MSKECFTEEERNATCEHILNDPIVKRYLYEGTWVSGENTTVYPATIWCDGLTFQLWNNPAWNDCWNRYHGNKHVRRLYERMFKGVFNRLFRSEFGKFFDKRYCHFSSSDGSCPATLEFKFKGWLD